ncbi:hypothetical protein DS745_18975 [Anaerobacillus alkaliphilus]|uniref:Pilus assembly protein PilO n=1 Tax=Anaerobacillus alkaliphilus TaxID=1548597 RepID=A0A4Q0VSL3_9BACI|nr:hypothetical protein [Anaerobacillus alkaliphilus]RXI98410.1 hypothetical protein DS745_18975 [Anaerobacillus alkaliphilus]
MNRESLRNNSILILINSLVVISLIAAYFLFIPPLNQSINAAEEQLKFEKALLEAVEKNVYVPISLSDVDVKTLQRKVPVLPLVDQFILDLEKAEVFSDSFITSYSFATSEYSGTGLQTEGVEEEVGQAPMGVEKVTVNMSVISPGFEELVQFLERIERLQRVTKVDSLSFTGYPEVTLLEQTGDDITFSVSISTFYLPELEEFSEYLPVLAYPQDNQKYNPLFYRVKGEKASETDE